MNSDTNCDYCIVSHSDEHERQELDAVEERRARYAQKQQCTHILRVCTCIGTCNA